MTGVVGSDELELVGRVPVVPRELLSCRVVERGKYPELEVERTGGVPA